MYLQNFTQHNNTTAAIIKKRVGTASVILFTLLSYNIYKNSFYLQLLFRKYWLSIYFETLTNNISIKNKKEKVGLILFTCYILSTFSFIFFKFNSSTFPRNISFLLSTLTSQTFILVYFFRWVHSKTIFSRQTSDLSRHTLLVFYYDAFGFLNNLISE